MLNFESVILLTNLFFYIDTIYLNFNRIDMKRKSSLRKRIRPQKVNSSSLTRSSSGKERRRRAWVKKRMPSVRAKNLNETKMEEEQSNISKSEEQTVEQTPDTPNNLPLLDYMMGIQSYVKARDQAYHEKVGRGLEQAKHIEITSDMRKILIGWLGRVGGKFRIKPQTLQICVQLIDFILIFHGSTITRKNFQLLGLAALFISCKYNEIYTAEAEKYVHYCDGHYTTTQLFQMQAKILESIGFELQVPTIQQFLQKMISDENIKGQEVKFMNLLTNVLILDFHVFNSFQKFHLAMAVLSISGMVHNRQSVSNFTCHDTFTKCRNAVYGIYQKNSALFSLSTSL